MRRGLVLLPIGLLLSIVQGSRRLGIPAHGVMHGVVTASYAAPAFTAFGYIAMLCLFLTRGGRPLQKALVPMGRFTKTISVPARRNSSTRRT